MLLRSHEDPEHDAIPPVAVTARVQPGDIWRLGEHIIGCGDRRELQFLQKVVGETARVDVAFLDPPSNITINNSASNRTRELTTNSSEMSDEEFRGYLHDCLVAAAEVSRDGAIHFICTDWRHMDGVSAIGRGIYGELVDLCIWDKNNAEMGFALLLQTRAGIRV